MVSVRFVLTQTKAKAIEMTVVSNKMIFEF